MKWITATAKGTLNMEIEVISSSRAASDFSANALASRSIKTFYNAIIHDNGARAKSDIGCSMVEIAM